ncbi:MAG: tyrosine--tRNA ligase [Microgenomates group bacterium]
MKTNISDLLTRGVENIIPSRGKLEELLNSGKKLNIYIGIDPTATRIHIGHAVPLRKLNELAKMGHNVKFLIGDFTALIGDTSDKDGERPVLTSEQIQANFETYKKQAEKVLDFSKIEVVHNSTWLKDLKFEDIVKLCQHFSAGDFTSRELIKKRLEDGKHVGLHELLYPVMQGYDSYFMDTDIQLGGTDQTFNMQAGRVLQKDLRAKESFIIANGFLAGTDGRKMSKSWGNAIWLDDDPNEMYGKVMSLKDDLIINYFTLATSLSLDEIAGIEAKLNEGVNPMTFKKQLALQLVTELHSSELALAAQSHFESTVQNKEVPDVIEELQLKKDTTILQALKLANLGVSNADIKRTLEQNGVEVDGAKISDPQAVVTGQILKFGKRIFRKIIIED